jgi:multiple sugar transport system permease protein
MWLRIGCGLLIVGVMLFPLYWMANASLQAQWALLDPSPRWLPFPPLIDGYKSAAGSQWPHIVTSCAVASAAALLSLAVAAPCAYALVVFRMRWTTFFILLMLIAQMLPHIVMANALYAIYAQLGLLDTYYGLILADSTMGVPFAILILRAFMASLPRTLVEAALCDGLGYWGVFFHIVLPLSRNGLITSGLFCFLFAWSDFIIYHRRPDRRRGERIARYPSFTEGTDCRMRVGAASVVRPGPDPAAWRWRWRRYGWRRRASPGWPQHGT